MEWNFADAKERFNELVTLALAEGPQRVRRGEDAVVVIASEEYDRLAGHGRSFKDHLMHGRSFEGLDLERDPGSGRDVEL